MARNSESRLNIAVNRLVDALSFSGQIRDLVDHLNRQVAETDDSPTNLLSHPGGYIRSLQKRRLGIAEAYLQIAHKLSPASSQTRLAALRNLIVHSLHAKTVRLPLNTARVQVELVKRAIKHQQDRRRQMELISDFSLASFGQESLIRRFLGELGLVQVPETNESLKDLDLGWDDHVHDSISEGRKTPTQLLLDAFIKGLSRLTVVYYDLADRDIFYEVMSAGKLLGIDVKIGVEFSVGLSSQRRHYMYVIPATTYPDLISFLEEHGSDLAAFQDGLQKNSASRRRTMEAVLDQFNEKVIPTLNEGCLPHGPLALKKLTVEDLEPVVTRGQASRTHLGELLFNHFREVLRRRVLAAKVHANVFRQLYRGGKLTDWELRGVESSYRRMRKEYERLTPEKLRETYFADTSIDYDSCFSSEEDVLPTLIRLPGRIVFLHPLSRGLSTLVDTVLMHHKSIDAIELFNMHDCASRDPAETHFLSGFIHELNNGTIETLRKHLQDWTVEPSDPSVMDEAIRHYHDHPLLPLASSDSKSRDVSIPGMGFIRQDRVLKKTRRQFARTHLSLPPAISNLVVTEGKGIPKEEWKKPQNRILALGKITRMKRNLVGDEAQGKKLGIRRIWRYLNPTLKHVLRVAAGAVPAYLWIGPIFTLVWFGITFCRNVLVDLIAASGLRVREWRFKDINFQNATQSLFWTGFSVPVLSLVKKGFDLAWPLASMGLLFEWSKFFFICMANGTYIAAHNMLRRFDHSVTRANFFRSVLAWPFASLFSPLGYILGVPAIVQAKFWSDVVAAVIEGRGKVRQMMVLRKRDLSELLPQVSSPQREVRLTAMLDTLFIWARAQRGRTALSQLLSGPTLMVRLMGRLGRKQQPLTSIQPYKATILLYDAFEPERSHLELSRISLDKHRPGESVLLTDLLAVDLVRFHLWLQKRKKKLAGQAPGAKDSTSDDRSSSTAQGNDR